jgi:hypothetical protein
MLHEEDDNPQPVFMMMLVSLSAFFSAGCFFYGFYAACSWLLALTWM